MIKFYNKDLIVYKIEKCILVYKIFYEKSATMFLVIPPSYHSSAKVFICAESFNFSKKKFLMVKIKRELSNIFLMRSRFYQPYKQKQNKKLNVSYMLCNAFNFQNQNNFYNF